MRHHGGCGLAADVLGIDYRATERSGEDASYRQAQMEAERQQREQERQQQAAEETNQRRLKFTRRYAELCQQATMGESEYLIGKGLQGLTIQFQLLASGDLLLPLVDDSGAAVAAQTITTAGENGC